MQNNILRHLSLPKMGDAHHCFLVSDLYSLNNCKLLLEYFSEKYEIGYHAMLSSPDFLFHTSFVEDSIPLKVEHARNISSFAQNTGFSSQKVIVIEAIETASISAINALLKIIEEPPQNTSFYLIYSSLEKVLETIRSRSAIVKEHITKEEDFKSIAEFLGMKQDFISFKECGYNFNTYQNTISIKGLSFTDVFQKLQNKVDDSIYKEVCLFIENKIRHVIKNSKDYRIIKRCFKLLERMSFLLKVQDEFNINKQNILIELVAEVHDLVD